MLLDLQIGNSSLHLWLTNSFDRRAGKIPNCVLSGLTRILHIGRSIAERGKQLPVELRGMHAPNYMHGDSSAPL